MPASLIGCFRQEQAGNIEACFNQPGMQVLAHQPSLDPNPKPNYPAIYCAPFTVIVAPVMKAASSAAR